MSNKDGHGKKGTVIAIVKGTKAQTVSAILKRLPESEREKVTEITMDFSDSMFSIAKQCFPKATIVIDCFHIVQRLCEGLEEMRLRFKRLAVTESRKEAAAFAQDEDRKAKQRAYYRKRHPKNKKERRGRKRIRKQKYKPTLLANGETKVEMLTRSRNMLAQSGDKWGDSKKERARILFGQYPQMKEATYAARNAIKGKEEYVLNYFLNRSTNAAAESLNSKIKGFRAQLHGIADIPFFLYRVCTIFG